MNTMKPTDPSPEPLDALAVGRKVLTYLAESPEPSPRVWECYSREQVKLEMQARFCRQEMSREEADRLRSVPTTLGLPCPIPSPIKGLLSFAALRLLPTI